MPEYRIITSDAPSKMPMSRLKCLKVEEEEEEEERI